jgi:hypothetical protein
MEKALQTLDINQIKNLISHILPLLLPNDNDLSKFLKIIRNASTKLELDHCLMIWENTFGSKNIG